MHIWDTAGSESSRPMLPLYYREASGGIVTYDITSEGSFKHVDYWQCKELSDKTKTPNIIIVGNKLDLPDSKREVPTKLAMSYANNNGHMFQETSAKTGDHIDFIFESLGQKIFDDRTKEEDKSEETKE